MVSDPQPLDRFLEEVSAALPRRGDRADILAEIRSAILDRAEEIARGEPTPEAIAEAVARFGSPWETALAYGGERYLVGPRHYPWFVAYTGILFAVHLVLIVAASVLGAEIALFPLSAPDVSGRHQFLRFAVAALQALLFDIGLMAVVFAAAARMPRAVRLPNLLFRVRHGLRHCLASLVLALVALAALNPLRDVVFVVHSADRADPLLTAEFLRALPLVNAFLVALLLRAAAYALLRERRASLVLDAAVSGAGAVLMVWLLTRSALIAFPAHVATTPVGVPTVNHLVAGVTRLLLLVFATALAAETVKRLLRLRQL